MKGVFAFLLLLLLMASVSAIYITPTGKSITGKPLQYFGMNITIIRPPVISIIAPENGTYLLGDSIPLNYSADELTQSVWYSLDSGNNITITSATFFNASEGSHELILYANNSDGESSTRVSFEVNSSIFKIIYDEWKGAQKGDSTNFSIFSYEDVQNLSGITLENTNYGKILFNQNINMTADGNFSDNQIDLDTNINVSLGRISIDATSLPNFNTSATLWFYNLTFTNPMILKDGVLCPLTICANQTYSDGVLKVDVNQAATYTIQETPVTPPPKNGGGGGGGGGGAPPIVESFSINKPEINVTLSPGTSLTENITIKNNVNRSIVVNLNENGTITNFLTIGANQIQLQPGESKDVLVNINVGENATPDLYAGEIIFSEGGTTKEALVVLEVVSKGALLDVSVKILNAKLYSVNEILAQITLSNLVGIENGQKITVDYIIKDTNGNQLSKEEEIVTPATQTQWTKILALPKDITSGVYILYIKTITSEGKIASASTNFEVLNAQGLIELIIILIIFLIIVVGLVIYILSRRREKEKKQAYKILKKHL